ncbi:hypothetical protein ACFWY9_32015 [Amycolatopsis sp. NPDC059027]|uniref:hypothetical protein n=1 Tax=Amycolatopsis sp. NPDC059027 TaxID=3346709 RepID=UPI00366D5BA5
MSLLPRHDPADGLAEPRKPRRPSVVPDWRVPRQRTGTPLSAAAHQRTCAVCGVPFSPGERTELQSFTDGEIRYTAVHPGHSIYASRRERRIADRLRRVLAA